MEVFILVILFKMKYLARGNMFGLMARHMKDNGKRIKCMDMEFSFGKMEKNMKVTS